jgi:hypothetical protein
MCYTKTLSNNERPKVSIQIIRAKIAKHKAAEFLSPPPHDAYANRPCSDNALTDLIKHLNDSGREQGAYLERQKEKAARRLQWLQDLLALQTELVDATQRSDLE